MTPQERRPVVALMRDLLEACDAGAVIVERGKDSWDDDVILRLAGEAVAGRIGDAASKLPNEVREQISGVAWTDVIALRIRVDHIYHRLDYAILWSTLAQDVPNLRAEIQDWLELTPTRDPNRNRLPKEEDKVKMAEEARRDLQHRLEEVLGRRHAHHGSATAQRGVPMPGGGGRGI